MLNILLGVLPLVFAIVAFVVFVRRRQPLLRSFGLTVNRWSPLDALVGLGIPAVAFGLVLLAEWALRAITVARGDITLPSFLSDVLAQLFVAALAEEIIYRVGLVSGVVAVLDRVPYGRWIAVVATAALFGAAHLSNDGATWIAAVGTGLGGVIYAVAFIATRSIILPLALHLSWNMSEGLLGFPISGHLVPGILATTETGPIAITGGDYGPEAGLPGMIARIVVFTLLVIYLKRRWPEGRLSTLHFAPDPQPKSRTAGKS